MNDNLTLLDLLERIYARAHDTERDNLIDQLNWRAAAELGLRGWSQRNAKESVLLNRFEPGVRKGVCALTKAQRQVLESMAKTGEPDARTTIRVTHPALFNLLWPGTLPMAITDLSGAKPFEWISEQELQAYRRAVKQCEADEAVWKRFERWVRYRLPPECATDPLETLRPFDTSKKWPVTDAYNAEKYEIPRLCSAFAKIDTPENAVAAVKEVRKRLGVPWLVELEREINENAQVLIEGHAMKTLAALQRLSAMRSADDADTELGSPLSAVKPNKANRASEPKPKVGRPTISPERRELYNRALHLNKNTKRFSIETKLAEFSREFPNNVKTEQDMVWLIQAAREHAKRDARK